MDAVYESVMLSDVTIDDERFRGIIDAAIEEGKAKSFKKYTDESEASKKRRVKAAKAEADEAMAYAEELGVKDKLFAKKSGKAVSKDDDQGGLKALIMKRQQDRQEQGNSFLDRLEAKYAGNEKKSKGKGKAKKNAVEEAEPDEEAFQKAAARLKAKKNARNIDEQDEEPPKRRKRVKRS